MKSSISSESTIFFYTYKNWKRRIDEIELTLIESRFCTVEEAEAKCPQGIRLFKTNNSINEYNNKILNAYEEKTTSTAKDVYIGCTSKEQETIVRQKLQ
ncbi:ATP-dependent DNA helicase [Trichonephila clavipes]|nr:ATP-dependent DNA helicase [Trichonephila clavipes]